MLVIKGVMRGRNSKERQYNRQKIKGKGQSIIHKTLQKKIKIEQHEPTTVGLCLFSMSVCQFHRWFVFVFYECLSVPPLVCFCFL
jgi:hypothetical protein